MSECVLVVDDDPVTLKLISKAIESSEMEWVAAASGEEALGLMQTESIAVLVTDLVMPGIDGIELFARARLQRPLLRGILTSAHLDYGTLLRIIEVGFDDCMIKPIGDLHELATSVRNSLSLQRLWRARIAELRGFTMQEVDETDETDEPRESAR